MDTLIDTHDWAESEFGHAAIPDARNIARLVQMAQLNPFTYVVELIRFALQGQFNAQAFAVVLVGGLVFFGLALRGYDPQRGWKQSRA